MSHGSSLNEAAKALKDVLGDSAPARITLHRHSASGVLDAYVVRQSGTRRYYDASRLIDHYRKDRADSTRAASAGRDRVDSARIAEEVARMAMPLIEQRITEAIAPTRLILEKLSSQVGDLIAVRQSLMLKYDAVSELTQQKLRRAEEDLTRVQKTDSHVEMKLSKIAIELSRVNDTLAQLANREG